MVGHDGVGLGEVEVRAVVADLHTGGAGEQVAGRVPQLPVGLAALEAADGAALRVGGARGDPAGVQGVGVDDASVAGGVHHVHLAVGGDPVEVVAGGVAALGEAAVLVAEAADGHAGGQFAGGLGQYGDQGVDVGDALGTAVDPGQGLPVHHRVAVGVDEPGVDQAAVELQRLVGPAAEGRAGVLGRADVHDAVAAHGEGLRAGGGAGRRHGGTGHQQGAVGTGFGGSVVHGGSCFRPRGCRGRRGDTQTADSFAWTIDNERHVGQRMTEINLGKF